MQPDDRQPTVDPDPLSVLETDPDFGPLYVGIVRRAAQRQADTTGVPYENVAARLARVILASNSIREAGRRTHLDP